MSIQVPLHAMTNFIFNLYPEGLGKLAPSTGAFVYGLLCTREDARLHLAAIDTLIRSVDAPAGHRSAATSAVTKYLVAHGIIVKAKPAPRRSPAQKVVLLHAAGWSAVKPTHEMSPALQAELAQDPPTLWWPPTLTEVQVGRLVHAVTFGSAWRMLLAEEALRIARER